MKFTGLTRRIEIGGRLSLPKGIREHFQTEYIQIYVQKNMIYLSCNVEESKLTKDSLFKSRKLIQLDDYISLWRFVVHFI